MIPGGPPTIDNEDVAGGEGVIGGGKEEGGDRDFVRITRATERHMIDHALDVFVEEPVGGVEELASAVGHDRAGGDGVDEDAITAKFDGHGSREIVYASFGCGEGALQTERDDTGDGGYVDDATTALRAHDFGGGAADFVEAGEIHGEDAIPLFAWELVDGDAMREGVDACVVDDDVEATAAFDHSAHGGIDLVRLGDIEGESVTAGWLCGGFGSGLLDVSVEHRGSVRGEAIRDGFADAIGGSGDKGDLVFEVGLHGKIR